jgi:signal transduction histidine kinase
MMRVLFLLLLNFFLFSVTTNAQQKSELQQKAENEEKNGHLENARSLYIKAFENYTNSGQHQQAVECGVKATSLYYKGSDYKEAFEFLRQVEQTISSSKLNGSGKSALRYQTTKERLQMYMRLRKNASAADQIEAMERFANASKDENLLNDLLYNKAVFYYAFGQNAQGNAVFKEMATKLTAQKEYDKVDEVYQTLIANGRKSNSASLVAQSYSSYMLWKDSVNALKIADTTNALKQQIAENEATIAEKDDSLASRKAIIIGFCIFLAILIGILVVGAIVLMRFILLTRKQKKIINTMKENNELKVKFINNISAQLHPTLQKLDQRQPEVKALIKFSDHVQTLSELENTLDEKAELEEVPILPLCEELMDQIRDKVKGDVKLMLNVPKMTAMINKEYVSHILLHLLNNAVKYTEDGGHIRLEFKKRGAHSYQFIVTDTGCGIPVEKHEDVFKPFLEVRDLCKGDGLGLPICKQMALKMNGDLDIDPEFTKGTRFLLSLHD